MSIKFEGVDLDIADLRMVQGHYLNIMNDVTLLTQLAAGMGLGIDEMYVQCKERVASIQKRIVALEAKSREQATTA